MQAVLALRKTKSMTNRTALITGVSRPEGIGFATAKELSAMGYTVIISARNPEKARQLAGLINATPVAMDVTNEDSVQQAASGIATKYGRLDLLINNAGVMLPNASPVAGKDLAELQIELDTNVIGVWRVTKHFLPLLQKSTQPRIVNISSTMGSFTAPGWGLLDFSRSPIPAYSITKLALNGLTVKTAREHQNIRVNAVCPGFTATYPGMAEMGARPVEESIKGIIWAATLPDDGPSGGFFRDGEKVVW